jgi:hypothetical protein
MQAAVPVWMETLSPAARILEQNTRSIPRQSTRAWEADSDQRSRVLQASR